MNDLRPAVLSPRNGAVLAHTMRTILLAAALGASQQAIAQDEAAELEEVVVTGIRAGIEDAIEVKRQSGSIVEAISAEDIGKLPDTSIAESISRLPGLTSQRAEGRASAISLRGTDPGFTTALLNGREQVSTGDNRSIEFDQYPSELLSQVVVYKTPDAQLVGQGLAGTIDLRTVRPLDYGRRAIVMNLRGERNSQNDLGADSKDDGYRASFSYIDQFLDGRLGVAFGFARLNSPLATQGAGTYEPWHPNGNPSADYATQGYIVNPGVGPNVYVTDGIKIRTDMGENERDGAMAVLQFKPNDLWESTLDVYYSEREQVNNARSLEVNLGTYPGPCCDGGFASGTQFGYANPIIRDNTVVGGTLLRRVPLARNFLFKTQDEIMAAGWMNEFTFDAWKFSADVSYSKAERDEQQYETNAQYRPNIAAPNGTPRNVYDTGQFQLEQGAFPQLTFNLPYDDRVSVQVGPTIYGAGYSKIPHVEDELTSARVDIGRTVGTFFSEISAGINYSDRTKTKLQPEGNLSTRANANGNYWQVAPEYLLAPTNLSYAGAGSALAWDVESTLAQYYNPIVYGTPDNPNFAYLIGKNWEVEEKVTTAYVRGLLDYPIRDGLTLKGNIGVQVIETDQSSTALRRNGSTGLTESFTDGKKFTDVLPAINLAFVFDSQQAFRIGIAKEIARARMDQLKASSELGYGANGVPGGSGGNPQLDPWEADAYDISYEKYFAERGYFSIAAFQKKLKTYIYNQTIQDFDFSFLIPTLPPGFLNSPAQPTGSFSTPVNGKGGNLKGVELSVSLPGSLLSEGMDPFGAIFSISQTSSDIRIEDPPGNNFLTGNNLGNIPLPGLSKTVWNLTLYYEKSGFSARVATRSRSEYIGEVTNFANDRAFKYVQGDRITDAQLGYEFGDGMFKGLSVLFQVNNLTNEPYEAYAVRESRQQDFQSYGRQYLLGVNYKVQ